MLPQLDVRALFKAPPGPGSADLGGIASDNLFVAAAIQKATITVDENGTEAAAATALMGGTTDRPGQTANHLNVPDGHEPLPAGISF